MIDQDDSLERLKALDILQIASDLGRQPDRNGMISCPIHNEKTPSLKLDQKKGLFKCFGCGEGGSTIDLYAKSLQLDFSTAVKEMKARYLGILDGQPSNVVYRKARPVPTVEETTPQRPAEEFSPIYSALQNFCWQHPPTEVKHQALAYFKSRAFTVDTIRHFGLFVIPDPKATANFLTSTYKRDELEASGLFSPKGFMFYRHPIVIPYLNRGQIVNLQARCIGEAVEGQHKYQYLRSRPITTMFNIDAIGKLAPGTEVYLTEGAFDTMATFQKGGLAVSINSVSGFKPDWVNSFKNLSVCFLLDSDGPGQAAVKKLAPLFQREKIPVSRVTLPPNCKDVNEWLIKYSGYANGYPAFWDH